MTYRGHVQNGVVVADEPVVLPDGAEVEFVLLSHAAGESQKEKDAPASELMKFSGRAVGLPEDASLNLEYYLYGHHDQ